MRSGQFTLSTTFAAGPAAAIGQALVVKNPTSNTITVYMRDAGDTTTGMELAPGEWQTVSGPSLGSWEFKSASGTPTIAWLVSL